MVCRVHAVLASARSCVTSGSSDGDNYRGDRQAGYTARGLCSGTMVTGLLAS